MLALLSVRALKTFVPSDAMVDGCGELRRLCGLARELGLVRGVLIDRGEYLDPVEARRGRLFFFFFLVRRLRLCPKPSFSDTGGQVTIASLTFPHPLPSCTSSVTQ